MPMATHNCMHAELCSHNDTGAQKRAAHSVEVAAKGVLGVCEQQVRNFQVVEGQGLECVGAVPLQLLHDCMPQD